MSLGAMVRRPSAFLPLAMSAAALAVVLLHVARYGVAREPDEGATAHIWQLLMVGQLPVIGFFAVTWLPRDRKQAGAVLALQALAILAAAAPVFVLHL